MTMASGYSSQIKGEMESARSVMNNSWILMISLPQHQQELPQREKGCSFTLMTLHEHCYKADHMDILGNENLVSEL